MASFFRPLVFVFLCVVAMGFCKTEQEVRNPNIIGNINKFLPPMGLNLSQADIDRQDSIQEVEHDSEWPMIHSREKRGLRKRLKKLGRSIDRSFRKVRDSALPAIGAGIGARVASG